MRTDARCAGILPEDAHLRTKAAHRGVYLALMCYRQEILRALDPSFRTPLVTNAAIARRAGVASIYVKVESARPFGNFKVLGGLPAALNALARWAGVSVKHLLEEPRDHGELPMLICASDGNHGLAVAAAALAAGARATIVLHRAIDAVRVKRICALGADIVFVDGSYDDAVDHAAALARSGRGLLVADTTDRADDPVVGDVMRGYGRIADEIASQLAEAGGPAPTHLFVQAGVGGLAAIMAERLYEHLRAPRRIVVVEPSAAACVGHALSTGRIERIDGNLRTAAEMLSCGVASVPAIAILRRRRAQSVIVSEAQMARAVAILEADVGLRSTASGAAGLAGLLSASASSTERSRLALDASSVPMLIVTERG